MTTDNWFEISGALPAKENSFIKQHTSSPCLSDLNQNNIQKIFDHYKNELNFQPEFEALIKQGFELRQKLTEQSSAIRKIVGEKNLSFSMLDREAHSTDSMEHRAFVPEAVISVPNKKALIDLVTLLYKHKIPMIPYGEGSGYNMGVVPMAPAVTISVREINHISSITQSKNNDRYQITVGAGVPFSDLTSYIEKSGFVLRCNPNSPRAATGGIVATGSNAGKKAYEVVLSGKAVIKNGLDITFAANEFEKQIIQNEAFLTAHKFFSVSIPEDISFAPETTLPISLFVGSEGTTGIIYEVTFELEKPKDYLIGFRLQLGSTHAAIRLANAIKALPNSNVPFYFEYMSGFSIRKYLFEDFKNDFIFNSEACFIIGVEVDNISEYETISNAYSKIIAEVLATGELLKIETTSLQCRNETMHEWHRLIKPREDLPKKLRTKCKTDLEIRFAFLKDALDLIAKSGLASFSQIKEDILFGHFTPTHTAICHFNIGGLDLYNEEQAHLAWEYLERIFAEIRNLASDKADTKEQSAEFSGEHGIAGKAPFLWVDYLNQEHYTKLKQIKNIIDPENLFNPNTIFFSTRFEKSLRARLLPLTNKTLQNARQVSAWQQESLSAENSVIAQALDCTRCNSCKVCPVIDAQVRLANKNGKQSSKLPSKRDLLLFLEKIVLIRRQAATEDNQVKIGELTNSWIEKDKMRLDACFYCRKCDTNCPVNIDLKKVNLNYLQAAGLTNSPSLFANIIYSLLLGNHKYKPAVFKLFALAAIFLKMPLALLRKLNFAPWIKTYFNFPTVHFNSYKSVSSNLIAASDSSIYIRFKGCFDTFGNQKITIDADWYLQNFTKMRIIDLPDNLCCGFPFLAAGLGAKAEKQRADLAQELAKLFNQTAASQQIFVFSNCPTCVHSLNTLRTELEANSNLRHSSGFNEDLFVTKKNLYIVKNSEELVLLSKTNTLTRPAQKKVAFKVPCHNTKQATEAQTTLLKKHFATVELFSDCCGLSGSKRFLHPKIGTEIAMHLFNSIVSENTYDVIVSNCPSCRDGVKMEQANKNDSSLKEIPVLGIFEAIRMHSQVK